MEGSKVGNRDAEAEAGVSRCLIRGMDCKKDCRRDGWNLGSIVGRKERGMERRMDFRKGGMEER